MNPIPFNLRRIVWLASFHKSGNTWVRAFLANYFAPKGAEVGLNQLFDEVVSDVRQDFFDQAAGRPFRGATFDDSIALRPKVLRPAVIGLLLVLFLDMQFRSAEGTWIAPLMDWEVAWQNRFVVVTAGVVFVALVFMTLTWLLRKHLGVVVASMFGVTILATVPDFVVVASRDRDRLHADRNRREVGQRPTCDREHFELVVGNIDREQFAAVGCHRDRPNRTTLEGYKVGLGQRGDCNRQTNE